MKKNLLIAVAFVLAMTASLYAADTYAPDRAHSSVTFCVKHMVLSTVCGRFKDFDATILLDQSDITKSSFTGTIKTASIWTDHDQRDADLKSASFFDVEKYPEITFKSSKIEKTKDGYVATGTLTMHGVSKDIQLPFTLTGPVNLGDKTKIGISATMTLNRQDYGISWAKKLDSGGLVVSDEVKVTIESEAALKK